MKGQHAWPEEFKSVFPDGVQDRVYSSCRLRIGFWERLSVLLGGTIYIEERINCENTPGATSGCVEYSVDTVRDRWRRWWGCRHPTGLVGSCNASSVDDLADEAAALDREGDEEGCGGN